MARVDHMNGGSQFRVDPDRIRRWRAGDEMETYDWMVRPFVLEIQGNWRAAAAMWQALGCLYEQARALADGDSEAQKAALVIF